MSFEHPDEGANNNHYYIVLPGIRQRIWGPTVSNLIITVLAMFPFTFIDFSRTLPSILRHRAYFHHADTTSQENYREELSNYLIPRILEGKLNQYSSHTVKEDYQQDKTTLEKNLDFAYSINFQRFYEVILLISFIISLVE